MESSATRKDLQNAWPTDSECDGNCSKLPNNEICLAKRGQAAFYHAEGRPRREGIKAVSCTLVLTSAKLSPVFHFVFKAIQKTTSNKKKQSTQPWRKDITAWDVIHTLTSTNLSIR
jgi:hypothetical protein